MEREARCFVPVSAAGDALQAIVEQLAPGSRIRVSGFLNRARDRSGATRLVLHATGIEIIQ
jgi:primosomal replication protein N